ncbi:hypothetical protein FGO68_gene10096 [Halteria grandinella]|uniref:Uncharacterized protein n=1 Tax=Halteria grandinella TaxID=5974 RepID=A0A8J8T7M8_HALGN|nr:hypothetical protein FGO68_gene10096 [Halteria grandinella]
MFKFPSNKEPRNTLRLKLKRVAYSPLRFGLDGDQSECEPQAKRVKQYTNNSGIKIQFVITFDKTMLTSSAKTSAESKNENTFVKKRLRKLTAKTFLENSDIEENTPAADETNDDTQKDHSAKKLTPIIAVTKALKNLSKPKRVKELPSRSKKVVVDSDFNPDENLSKSESESSAREEAVEESSSSDDFVERTQQAKGGKKASTNSMKKKTKSKLVNKYANMDLKQITKQDMKVTIVIKTKNKVKLGDSVRQSKIEQAVSKPSAKEQAKPLGQSKVSSFCIKDGGKPKDTKQPEAAKQEDSPIDFTKLSPQEIKDQLSAYGINSKFTTSKKSQQRIFSEIFNYLKSGELPEYIVC